MLKKKINRHLSDLMPLPLPSCVSMKHYSKTILGLITCFWLISYFYRTTYVMEKLFFIGNTE